MSQPQWNFSLETFWKFMHSINTFYSYICDYLIRVSSLKNIITKNFFQERSWMIDLSWFTEWATLLLSYSSIVRWNMEKKNTRGNDCQENGLIACQPALYCSLFEKVEWFVARGVGGRLFLAVYQAQIRVRHLLPGNIWRPIKKPDAPSMIYRSARWKIQRSDRPQILRAIRK